MQQPNPPVWPESVVVFNSHQSANEIEATVEKYTSDLLSPEGHFSCKRIALLFLPGTYNVDVPVGYYVQVLGLGNLVEDVVFEGHKAGVHCRAADPTGAGSLDTFWRSAENFAHKARIPGSDTVGMMWAVSQAAPLRRISVEGDLCLHDGGLYASGGYSASIFVKGTVDFGSQQQWIMRSSAIRQGISSGAWSFVFVGVEGAPRSRARSGDEAAYTTIESSHVVAEKPYIFVDCGGRYSLQVPAVRYSTSGVPTDGDGETVAFERVFVAKETDSSAKIQSMLDAGLHVVFSPGVYTLASALSVARHRQVLLGIGMATLVAAKDGCIKIPHGVKGVRIAGLMLQASSPVADVLLEVGSEGMHGGASEEPTVLSDVFVRVGGPLPTHQSTDRSSIGARAMVRVHSSHVIGDNLWLWRADHAELAAGEASVSKYHLVRRGEYVCDSGLLVYGHDVTVYGLAVEHTARDQVVWTGERGKTYFYQCELPYEVTTAEFEDFVGYKVGEHVAEHDARGMGVYSFFRDAECLVKTAVIHPESGGMRFENVFTVQLDGKKGILSARNGKLE